jgi:hypothetical protein
MGDIEDRVAELKTRMRRLDGAMSELERTCRTRARDGLPEAVRDFERDLEFLERTFARLRESVSRPPAAE